MPLSNHRNCRVPAARLRHANSAKIPLYGILATTSIHPTLARLSLWLSYGRTSGARATSRSSHGPSVPAFERTRSSTPPFFFQAEDGIRDYKVTGVQTCALPI